jgi:N-acetylglutamate synthase-like GNAT family acetyltransferase
MSHVRCVQVFSNIAPRGVRRQDGSQYATLASMHRMVSNTHTQFPQGMSGAWLARRWYYTPKSHRAYSVRQISPGDRRLLAEFALGLTRTAPEREHAALRSLTDLLFDRVISTGADQAVGFAALENTSAGDRVIGTAAYAPDAQDGADFLVAVASGYRDEQVGRTLLTTLVRHARHAGVPRLHGEMAWSNRPMQVLAMAMGFAVEPVASDRNLRRLVLTLK